MSEAMSNDRCSTVKRITTPLDAEAAGSLSAGDRVVLSGYVYTGRDAAHRRFCEALGRGAALPVDLRDQVLFYTGPSPAPPGMPVGSAGPTTSYRMDGFTPELLRRTGLRGMIGKGDRSDEVISAMKETKAVYFAAIGGAGALIANHIEELEIICYEDLGPEAVYRFVVRDLPLIVAIDSQGNDVYRGAITF